MRWLPDTKRSKVLALLGAALCIIGIVVDSASANWTLGAALVAVGLAAGLYAESRDRAHRDG